MIVQRLLTRIAGALLDKVPRPAAPPAGRILLYADAARNKLYALKSDGTAVDLEATGSGSGAPTTADYLVKTADAGLSAERVVTDTSWISVDWGTAGQAKFNLADAGLVSLASADAAAGLPYVSGANTWTALTLAADKLIASSSSSAMTTEGYGTVRAASKIPKSTAEGSLWGWAMPHPTREVWGMFSARSAGFDAYAQTQSISVTTQSNQSDSDGVFRGCATGGTAGNGITLELTLGAGVYAKKGTRASLIFRTDPTLFTTDCRLWIGWCSSNPGDSTTISAGDAIMVRAHSDDGDTQFTPYSRDNTTTTAGSAFGPTLANATIYRIDFEWTSSTSCTITIVDVNAGTTASSTITTTLPRTGQPMDFVVQMYTKSNNVRRLDWGALVQAMGWGQSPYLG